MKIQHLYYSKGEKIMANIMLTYRCNLKCPYCFANEFVNHSKYDISMENYMAALNFLKTSGNTHIGLIGGEPTLHDKFREILEVLLEDEPIESVTIYTNGIRMDTCLEFLNNKKFTLLINCNSPYDIGEQQFLKLRDNLDQIFRIEEIWKRVNLGINLYQNDLDFSYIIELLKRYNLHRVRMSVTVPNLDEEKKANPLEYLRGRKDYILKFILDCAENDIAPYYDCNVIPKCIWTDADMKKIEAVIKKFKLKNTNLRGDYSFCRPVIDILPNLMAVRCFGTSDFTKVSIHDFKCLTDLQNYYVNLVDCKITSCMKDDSCKGCYERKVLHCTAGCMAFSRDLLMYKLRTEDIV